MVATIKIDVVSAEEAIYSGTAEFVVLPGELGELGVYPHHTPLLTRLKAGAVRIQQSGQEEILIFVSGGMLEIQPNGITVLADTAIRGADLDEAKALAAKKSAEEALSNKSGNIDYAAAQSELASSIAQLAALAKIRKITH